jgi:choline transporter-like protein 2/4/5
VRAKSLPLYAHACLACPTAGCFSCCGRRDEAPKKQNPLRGVRMCKDILCCLIFLSFTGLLIAIMAIGVAAGDWHSLVWDSDYMGNMCGTGGRGQKAFYPRIPIDLSEQPTVVATQQYWNLKLYAVCVNECPKQFNLNSPQMVTDYGWTNGEPNNPTTRAIKRLPGKRTLPQWISATPTSEFMNRCVPRIDGFSKYATMCAYPNCTMPDAVAAGAVCQTDSPQFGASWRMTNSAMRLACIVEAKETETMQYQLAASDDASAAALASIAEVVGGFFEVITSLQEGIYYILALGILAPIVVSVFYMILLYLCTKIIIYGLLLLLVGVEVFALLICFTRSGISIAGLSGADLISKATNKANQTIPDVIGAQLAAVEDGSNWIYTAGFWILAVITVITLISIMLWRKKIAICAAIIKEATTVFKDVPTLLIFPILMSFLQVAVAFWFILGVIMLRTTKAEAYDLALSYANTTSVDPIGGMLRDISESGNLKIAMLAVHLYGFFVWYQWVAGVGWTSMSMTTSWWYYFKGDKENRQCLPLAKSMWLTLIFHTGSVAFAAFIIAFFDMLRVAVAYVQKQMEAQGQGSMIMKIAFFCVGCCLSCIRRTVKMISMYGLVFVASNGHSFCYACGQTCVFFITHAGQVTVNGIVIFLIRIISLLTAPLACAIIGFYLCEMNGNTVPMYPAIAIYIGAVLMTSACMNVFDCTITTIFVCCFEDQAKFNSQYMLQPHHKSLAAVFKRKPKKEAPEKAGLTKGEAPEVEA